MVIEETREGIRVSEVPWLELEPTLDSGQCFRFRREEDGCWTGVAGQHPLTLRETSDGLLFIGIAREEFEGFWRGYFSLSGIMRRLWLAFRMMSACRNVFALPPVCASSVRKDLRR